MIGRFVEGYSWISLIFEYIVYTFILFILLKGISIQYQNIDCVQTKNRNCSKSIYLLFCCSLLILMIFFPSFRYIRVSDQENNFVQNYYYLGGNDSVEYVRLFNSVDGLSYKEALKVTQKEYLYVFIIWVLRNLNIPYQLCLATFNIIMAFGLINFAKIFDLRLRSFFPLLSLLALYLASFNTLRWSMSLMLMSFFCKHIIKDDYKKCFLVMIIAVGIQEASIVLLMPLFGFWITKNLKRKKLTFLYILILCIICYIPSTLDLFIFEGMRHFNQIWGGGQIPITWLALYGILIINVFLFNKKYIIEDKNNEKIFYLILFLMPPTILEFSFFLAYRFSYYSHPVFYMFLIGLMASNRKKGIIGIIFNILYTFLLISILIKFWGGAGIESVGIPFIWGSLN